MGVKHTIKVSSGMHTNSGLLYWMNDKYAFECDISFSPSFVSVQSHGGHGLQLPFNIMMSRGMIW